MAGSSALFFALSNIFFKKGLRGGDHVDKFVGVFVSLLINNIINFFVLGTMVLSVPRSFPAADNLGIIYLIIGGLLNAFIGRYFLISCIDHVGSTRAGSLKISSPIFTLFAGVLFLREQLSLQSLIGILVIIFGVYYLSRHSVDPLENCRDEIAEDKGKNNKGIFLGILSGSCVGLGNVFRKLGVSLYPSPVAAVAIGAFAALIAVFFTLMAENKVVLLKAELKKAIKGNFVFGGIFTSLAQYSLFFSLRLLPVSIANSILSIEPLFVIFLASYLFNVEENINRAVVISACVIVVGSILIVTS